MTPKEHAKLLGLLFWIYAGFNLVVTLGMAVFWFGMMGVVMSEVSKAPRRGSEANPEAFVGMMFVIMIFVIVITLIFMIPDVVAGFALRKEKSWAKIWAIIACCLAVISFPFGTALGVYGFWFIFGDLGKAYFDNPHGNFSNVPPPPPNNWQ